MDLLKRKPTANNSTTTLPNQSIKTSQSIKSTKTNVSNKTSIVKNSGATLSSISALNNINILQQNEHNTNNSNNTNNSMLIQNNISTSDIGIDTNTQTAISAEVNEITNIIIHEKKEIETILDPESNIESVIESNPEKRINVNSMLVKKPDQSVEPCPRMDKLLARPGELEPSVVDKKIEMKYIKDGRAYRTFIFNLELYIKEKHALENLINKMKRSFGTSCAYKETEFGFAYGFAGDLSVKIKQYLIETCKLPSENFK